jgi:hypothetical protein
MSAPEILFDCEDVDISPPTFRIHTRGPTLPVVGASLQAFIVPFLPTAGGDHT